MIKRFAAMVLCTTLMLSVVAIHVSAQTVTGTITGYIKDKSDAVVPKAKLTAVNSSTGAVREAITNEDGFFQLSFVPLGTYNIKVELSGFRTIQKNGVLVELNKTTVSSFVLDVATVSTEVEVQGGEIPLVDTTRGEVKSTLSELQVEATPLAGRNMISLVEQVPGFQPAAFGTSSNNPTNSTGSYASFSGQGTRATTFQIDGVNNDDSSENQNRQNVNISTIKEFQVLTNAYSAEFGRAGGAVILVQTKSGTNKFHGDLYDFIQNDIFNANDFYTKAAGGKRTPVRRNQYGGTIGGPVLKDKLFLFGSVERISNVGKGSMSRFTWLPTDTPHACAPGEVSQPGGPYCVDPATHPHIDRDLAWMNSVMDLWKTPELEGMSPNDPASCDALIKSGRPNRCVLVTGLAWTQPTSDYTGRLDWNTNTNTTMNLRYQYSRQKAISPRIIMGDNYGTNNNRQYNLGYTLTHVFSSRQTGEFRYGFGNRNTNQMVTDSMERDIPTIRFSNTLVNPAASSDTLAFGGTIIGTSTNVPINRFQRDHQFVYNHTILLGRHTLRAGIDQRFSALDDIASGTQRGYWTFGTFDNVNAIACPIGTTCPITTNGVTTTYRPGFTGWELFLMGIGSGYNMGYGLPRADNRFKETNLYFEDSVRVTNSLTLNLGARWEGVGAPNEIQDRYSYGYGGDWNNIEPRIGFAWSPSADSGFLSKITGNPGDFVIRGGYGVYHTRVFQSIFSQSGLNFRFQPPNGFLLGAPSNPCTGNPSGTLTSPQGSYSVTGGQYEVSDPSCGFDFTPGAASRTTAVNNANGVRVAGGQLQTTLLLPDPGFHMPYVQQWNLTIERQLPGKMALQIGYNGNRGIGLPFFSGINDAQFGITSPLVSVDVGGGNFQPVVFDRVCRDFSDPICLNNNDPATYNPTTSGSLRAFTALNATTVGSGSLARPATLADKGIVIVNGVPHGYISAATLRTAERRPDPTNGRNILLSNFAYTYYNNMTVRLTKATSNGLTLSSWWTWSKTIDTGSESTVTNTDVNAPVGSINPQASLRALSAFHQAHRFVVSGAYDLPWMKSQRGVLGRVVGGWTISSVATFASGLPFTVLAGYDVNMDGVGGDRPVLADWSLVGASVDNGRPLDNCPTIQMTKDGRRCLGTQSQLQLPDTAFLPTMATSGRGDSRPLAPGENFPAGAAPRNGFYQQGQKNVDFALAKGIRVREGMSLQLRMELFNAFNRVNFQMPANRTLVSATADSPLGRISATANTQNYVNSARTSSARMGQLALRFVF